MAPTDDGAGSGDAPAAATPITGDLRPDDVEEDAMSQMKWISIREAATALGFAVVSLRRLIERNARRGPDGGIEALIDGVRAKKLGRTWRVQLGERWASTAPSSRS